MPQTRPRRPVDLSPAALVRAGVGGVLAVDLDLASTGRWVLHGAMEDLSPGSNRAEGPVHIVTVRGAIDQRASYQPCEGYTDGWDTIEARFNAAVEAVATAGKGEVQLDVHSPGGVVEGGFSALRRMRALADRRGVKVSSVADESAGSMGYALLILADKGRVSVPARGRTASIGTVIVRKPAEGMAGAEILRSSDDERKLRPNAIEPLDDQDRSDLQAILDSGRDDFVAWVAERRGVSTESIRALKGASISGEAARAAGLVDDNRNAHEVLTMATAEAALAAMREALGLSVDASVETMTSAARAGVTAQAEVIKLRAELAQIEAGKLALEEQTRQRAAEQARIAARSAFAGEVTALRTAGRLSPAAAAALLGSPGDAAQGVAPTPSYYDRHGEAAARDMLATLKTDAPQVPAVGARPGAVPVPASGTGTLTAAQIEHAKAIGADPSAYAAAIQPATQEAP